MAHQNYGLGAVLETVLDRWEGALDSLGVGDLAILERNVKIDAHEHALVLDQVGYPIDRELP